MGRDLHIIRGATLQQAINSTRYDSVIIPGSTGIPSGPRARVGNNTWSTQLNRATFVRGILTQLSGEPY